ncbi:MAG: transporter substrate-binding domain-containing protein [Bacteroidales bacterium]|nr:transporter substrate-binding domain-containing protein [Bacteroidales bacterium]
MNKTKKSLQFLRPMFLGLVVVIVAIMVTRSLFHREEEKKDALRAIRERGYLIALTDQNTLNYFIYRGEPMGYQLDLLESFAKYLGVPLKIIAARDISKLEYYLSHNAADVIALNLPITQGGKKKVHFSNPFGETRLVLVQQKDQGISRKGVAYVKTLKEFPADTVYLRQNSFLSSLYHIFYRATGRRARLKEVADLSQEDLIRKVSNGTIHFALCQENVAMEYKRFYSNVDVSVVAVPHFNYGWGVAHASDSLLSEIDNWLQKYKSSGDLKKTYLDYFDNRCIINWLSSGYFSVNSDHLSPFDNIIREQSKTIDWDWRLIASLIYEESHFHLGHISSRNASGLMQLMPETAKKFGIDSLAAPSRQIAGGIKYLRYLDKQLPEDILDPRERIYFILASYNVGIGKVLVAREKAEKYGKNKNKWNRHVDYYLLRRSKKEPQIKSDSLDFFPIDYKTEGFVDNIVNRFYHYRNLIK